MPAKTIQCLVCQEPLQYFESSKEMDCSFCGQKFMTNASCTHGHYVCDQCHSRNGIEAIRKVCLASTSKNPILLAAQIMRDPYIYMHGPEHHVLVGAVLLTAYKNCGGEINFETNLEEMVSRGRQVPGGICGLWGCCGAAVSTGIFLSLLTDTSPLSGESWGEVNEMTSQSLAAIGKTGGPRCCKRDSFTAIFTAARYVELHFGICMELPEVWKCGFYKENQQCIRDKCPYFPIS